MGTPNGVDLKSQPNGRSSKQNGNAEKAATPRNGYQIQLSLTSLAAIFAVLTTGSFLVGKFLAEKGIIHFQRPLLGAQHSPVESPVAKTKAEEITLPDPPIFSGKHIPFTRYTSKLFVEDGETVRSSNALLNHDGSTEYFEDEDGTKKADMNLTKHSHLNIPEDDGLDDDDLHMPAGQHLLVDIKYVEEEFLDAEVRLATAMIDVVKESELTLLSYHCHGLEPAGVSCVGVLLESHVSFHTWPAEGVITLDLFTCGPKSLLPLVDVIKRLFGLPRTDTNEEPYTVWTHKKRGFRYTRQEDSESVLSDLDRFLGEVDIQKEEIVSLDTGIQQIDVYDSIDSRFHSVYSYAKSISNDGSYESRHPELFRKDRLFFIDGALQSRLYGESAHHEALVHPAMITHYNPRRVLIVGSGTGAALREVLKHKTVETVVVLEIDENITTISETYLPSWNECRFASPDTQSCFEDTRVEVHYVDAVEWMIERFGDETSAPQEALFDVAIIDTVDPRTKTTESCRIFDNDVFIDALFNGLSDEGVLAAQGGEAGSMDWAPDAYISDGLMNDFINNLVGAGFVSVQEYEETHGRLYIPWRYIVAMKNRFSRAYWIAGEAEVALAITKRIVTLDNGDLALKHFDAATMMTYQFPSRVAETRFCRANPEDCGYHADVLDPYVQDHPVSEFEVRESGGERAGRGVYAKTQIKQGEYVSLDECVNQMYVPPWTNELLFLAHRKLGLPFWEVVAQGYVDGYGLIDSHYGVPCSTVDPGIHTFINHGCEGKYNIGLRLPVSESDIEVGTDVFDVYDGMNDVYNPHAERRYHTYDCVGIQALQDIAPGEEVLDNYLIFGGGKDQEDFGENLMELKSMCNGEAGPVAKYEEEQREDDNHL